MKNASATDVLPNYIVPPFNGIGANEYIADVTHEVPGSDGRLVPAVDFLSMVDTPAPWELNIWYNTLNAGFLTRVSGETDCPCIYGERAGLGRSHLMEFKANGLGLGEQGSELRLAKPGKITLTVKAAARLNEQPDAAIRSRKSSEKPFWDIERARVGDTRDVKVEALVNGESVKQHTLAADGHTEDMTFEVEIQRSSWAALRIYSSSYTNPVFVIVNDKPIREKKSIEWCLGGVDQCWSQKEKLIDDTEHADAVAAYEHARQIYRARLAEAQE